MTVVGVLLAAGAGRRLGRPKALVELHGEPLLTRGIRLLAAGGCDRVLVVLAADTPPLLHAVLAARVAATRVVVARDASAGMGASLRAGLAGLEADVQACVVALVDQPLIGPAAVARLRSGWHTGADVVVASYAGQQRNPVLLDRSVWADVAELAAGDVGVRPWLQRHPHRVLAVECADTGDPFDLDTPTDLRILREKTR